MIAGQLPQTAAALEEAVTIAATVAGRGPAYAALHHGVRAERDALLDNPPGLANPPAVGPRLPRRAFDRAAADIGDLPTTMIQAYPADADHAAVAAQRLRSAEARDPASYRPHTALALAWQAQLLLTDGRGQDARQHAEDAVSRLTHFADQPERIQAAMTISLTVAAHAATTTGDYDAAVRSRQRAGDIPRQTHRPGSQLRRRPRCRPHGPGTAGLTQPP
jgi:hypothetical protein